MKESGNMLLTKGEERERTSGRERERKEERFKDFPVVSQWSSHKDL